jgi:hypothetical protein
VGPVAWLKTLLGRRRGRIGAIVSFDDRAISCRWPDGSMSSVAWEELRAVEIRTTEAGPFAEDVFFLLRCDRGDCLLPQGAEGSDKLLDRLQKLPGFDNRAVIAAMTCTDNATFPCWKASTGAGEAEKPAL